MSAMTHSCACHDSSMWVMTHTVERDATQTTRSCVCHDSFLSGPWLIRVCAMSHSWGHSLVCTLTHSCVSWFVCIQSLIHVCHDSHDLERGATETTRSCVCQDPFMCVPWLIRVCNDSSMTHPCVYITQTVTHLCVYVTHTVGSATPLKQHSTFSTSKPSTKILQNLKISYLGSLTRYEGSRLWQNGNRQVQFISISFNFH